MTSNPNLNILFTDFWPNCSLDYLISNTGFGSTLLKVLNSKYNLTYNNSKPPNLIIYSVFGQNHKQYPSTLKILYTAEFTPKHVNDSQLSLSFFKDTNTNFRLPNYERIFGFNTYKLLSKPNPPKIFEKKKKFCVFIISNPNCEFRNSFFRKLSKYKKVDSCGKVLNNVNFSIPNRDTKEYYDFLSEYKFMICFENQSQPNYLTEKLYNAMRGHVIPIYWGDPLVHNTFNKNSFINVTKNNMDASIDRIIELDNNNDKYLNMLSQEYVNPIFLQKYNNREKELHDFVSRNI